MKFLLSHNGTLPTEQLELPIIQQRIQQLGGNFETNSTPNGQYEVLIRFGVETPDLLTPRELEVIQKLAEGLTNKEIAQSLSISPRTVNFHLDNIYSKLGVSSRTEAAVYALRHGWVQRALPWSD